MSLCKDDEFKRRVCDPLRDVAYDVEWLLERIQLDSISVDQLEEALGNIKNDVGTMKTYVERIPN